MPVDDVDVARVAPAGPSARPSVGSPTPNPAATASATSGIGGRTGDRPSGDPGRRSNDASSPTSARRSEAYARLTSVSKGTSANAGSPYHASRSANASFAHSRTVWT